MEENLSRLVDGYWLSTVGAWEFMEETSESSDYICKRWRNENPLY